MQLNAYCVYDAKSLVYGAPFYAPTDGAAIRSFMGLANDLNTTVGQYPTDFTLWRVGSFDDQNGQLTLQAPLVHISDAAALVTQRAQLPLFAAKPNGQDDYDPHRAVMDDEAKKAFFRDQGGNV